MEQSFIVCRREFSDSSLRDCRLLRPLRVSFKNYHATNPSAIRLTSALIEHLKEKSDAVVAYTSSVLGFVPLAATAVYSSTKATLHSYILS
jgi:short-subunit dehydrogenase involved in D-alanine esterification of teichoic acids